MNLNYIGHEDEGYHEEFYDPVEIEPCGDCFHFSPCRCQIQEWEAQFGTMEQFLHSIEHYEVK